MNSSQNQRVKSILTAARKYGRTLRRLQCRFNPETKMFDYEILVAKRHSGQRGGRLRGAHIYHLTNLNPESRATLRKIRPEPGCEGEISTY